MSWRNTVSGPKDRPFPRTLGPVADLESHLPEEWWNEIFDSLYLMTDGDVVENKRTVFPGSVRPDIAQASGEWTGVEDGSEPELYLYFPVAAVANGTGTALWSSLCGGTVE